MERYCVECYWFIPATEKCGNPAVCDTNYVYGGKIQRECKVERSCAGKCGVAGVHYKPKKGMEDED